MASASNPPPVYDAGAVEGSAPDAVTNPPGYTSTALRPKPSGSPLTSHTYTLNPNTHTDISLTLNTSHAPSPTNLPLFFFPGTIAGEVTLDLKHTVAIKSVAVLVSFHAPISDSLGRGVLNLDLPILCLVGRSHEDELKRLR